MGLDGKKSGIDGNLVLVTNGGLIKNEWIKRRGNGNLLFRAKNEKRYKLLDHGLDAIDLATRAREYRRTSREECDGLNRRYNNARG